MREKRSIRSKSGSQRGYILLTLMFFVAVLAIMAVAIAPTLSFQTKRDREEEMIHRGVQYSRAIRKYFKKFGRYPMRIEDLENTNNMRFLRRRYKDPITGKDFKLLHFGEVQMTMPGGVAGGLPASSGTRGPTEGSTPGAGTSSAPSPAGAASSSASQDDTTSSSSKVFGGGPIVGVVSASKDKSIREFNDKDHYNQWQFIYDPGTDRGGLLNTPAQPALQNAVTNAPQGMPGAVPGAVPNANPFGPGMGNGVSNMPMGQPPQNPAQPQQH